MKSEKELYPDDTMTAQERFDAVVRLETPDRVPLSLMLYYYAPLHTGTPMSQYMTDPRAYRDVMHQVWEEIGPWDIYYNINPYSRLMYNYVMMMRELWPGIELEENAMAKIDEIQYMDTDDYDLAMKSYGLYADMIFRMRMLPRFSQEAEGKGLMKMAFTLFTHALRQCRFWRDDFKWWRKQGAVVQIGYQAEMPFDTFSQARNVINFSMDLFKQPEKIRQAADHLARNFADTAILSARLMGAPTVQCYCHRTSNSFISPQQFADLAFPSMEMIVNRIVDAGLTPILHCDGDWLRNLKTMRQLPAKKVIIQLDGLTDIFAAKQEIGDHMCIFGDVPAAKLATGTPSEVEEYCHRLIEEVGQDGGFILAGG
ncbi:MAG: uroporphyrinogen decarboxylase family protein [Thermodesulfobacteriota bacterium]|nr:uroporphyrinogen decarboxylase family protein [Thermodesulfobacteriota bacterium]